MHVGKTYFIAALLALSAVPAHTADMISLHPNEVVARFGKPDQIKSTEKDKPRPPFVTRMLEYKKERVRFVLIPDVPVGSPPPYKNWLLMGTQDTQTNEVISATEVAKRMQGRVKN